MNEYKDINIENLPHDILTEDYELECFACNEWVESIYSLMGADLEEKLDTLRIILSNILKYRCKKVESKQPTSHFIAGEKQ